MWLLEWEGLAFGQTDQEYYSDLEDGDVICFEAQLWYFQILIVFNQINQIN